jgi:hypothetical protein
MRYGFETAQYSERGKAFAMGNLGGGVHKKAHGNDIKDLAELA